MAPIFGAMDAGPKIGVTHLCQRSRRRLGGTVALHVVFKVFLRGLLFRDARNRSSRTDVSVLNVVFKVFSRGLLFRDA